MVKQIYGQLIAGLLIAFVLAAAPVTRAQQEPADVATPKLGKDGKVDTEFQTKHEEFLHQGKESKIGLLLLGDSITAGWFWGRDREVYDAHFGKYDPANFGIGGDRTEHVLWRIDNGELDGIQPKVVVLLIGTNNIGYPAEQILAGDVKIVSEIHQKLPDTKVLVVGIFPRGADPADPAVAGMRAKIKTVNQGLARLDDGKQTRFLDIGQKLVSADGSLSRTIMPDALHLNYSGYQIWADAMQPLLDEMMK